MELTLERAAPFIATLFYGGWAAYSNMEFGFTNAMGAFAVQGGFAFASTWLLTSAVAWLLARRSPPRYLMTFVNCAAMLAAIPAALHYLIGTQAILMAMLPGLIIGNSYVVLLLSRHRAQVQ